MKYRRQAGGARARWIAAVVVLLLSHGQAQAQILPPIYKPLPVEQGAKFHAAADSLRAQAAEMEARAKSLQEGALTLRQNGTGVVEKLREQARKLSDEVGRLEAQANADALTAGALRAQADEFARRAAEREFRLQQLREDLGRLRATAEAVARRAAPADTATGDTATDPVTAGAAYVPVDSVALQRIRELETQFRADSLTAETFRGQAADLTAQARTRDEGAASTRKRAQELRQQEAQLRSYAEEITTGRTASESTVARLEGEARVLQRNAERLALEAKAQAALGDEWRVQAGRALLPVRSRAEAMRFYGEDGRSVMRNLVFSVGSGGGAGTINSELVSDYAGPVRLGVGFVLAEATSKGAQSDSAATPGQAVERFYAGGGNFVLYSMLPLAFFRSDYHSLTLQTLGKVGLDVPGSRHAASAGSVPTNLDLGLEAYGTFNTFGSKIKTFALLRSAYAFGNDAFYLNLDREQAGAFPYAQLTFGTEIASVAKVLLSGAYGGGDLNRDISLTFQVAPARN